MAKYLTEICPTDLKKLSNCKSIVVDVWGFKVDSENTKKYVGVFEIKNLGKVYKTSINGNSFYAVMKATIRFIKTRIKEAKIEWYDNGGKQ